MKHEIMPVDFSNISAEFNSDFLKMSIISKSSKEDKSISSLMFFLPEYFPNERNLQQC
jgi:hypothetical protein